LLSIRIVKGKQKVKPYPPRFILTKVLQAVLQNTIGVACNLRIPQANLLAASNFEQVELKIAVSILQQNKKVVLRGLILETHTILPSKHSLLMSCITLKKVLVSNPKV